MRLQKFIAFVYPSTFYVMQMLRPKTTCVNLLLEMLLNNVTEL